MNLLKIEKKYIQKDIEKISLKKEKVDTSTQKGKNKVKHLQECIDKLTAIIQGTSDNREFIKIYDIYSLVWDKSNSFNVDISSSNIKSLEELYEEKEDLKETILNMVTKLDTLKLSCDENGVPFQISPRQARLVLLKNNLLETVESSLEETDKESYIEWEYATYIERNSKLIKSFAKILHLSDEQIDDMFVEGILI